MQLRMKIDKKHIGFDDRWMMFIGIPVVAFFIPILFFKADLSKGFVAYLPDWGISIFYTTTYWLTMRTIFLAFRRRYPEQRQTARRILFTLLAGVTAFAIINLPLDWVHETLGAHDDRPGVTEFDYTVGSFTVLLLVSTLYESIWFYYRWKESLLEAEQLRREFVESQLQGLKDQVNPHFLFNSLNTLTYLIPEDPEKAVRFVQQLSNVYRYILDIRDQRLIPLEQELAFLEAYLFLLKERFGANLIIRKHIDPEASGSQIIPLSLQMLLENAIKHNIISEDKPLTIRLYTEGDLLVVSNNLQRKRQVQHSTKVGLDNIKHRYAFFTDRELRIEETESAFTVHVPLLRLASAPVGQ